MSVAECSQRLFRIVGRSFLAFVLTPQTPLDEWVAELDAWIARSNGFFSGRPLVVDFSRVQLNELDVAALLLQLKDRNLRIIGVEAVDPDWVGPELGPLPSGGRATSVVEIAEKPPEAPAEAPNVTHLKPVKPVEPEPTALLLDTSVRSGQSIIFPNGDITVTGSVASGSELIAAGSIHVYGCLRGRAIAGSGGNAKARIFCNSFDAELLAIDGLYQTAEDIEPQLRGRAIQAWLDGDVLRTAIQG